MDTPMRGLLVTEYKEAITTLILYLLKLRLREIVMS